jgi:hypothetical protein
MRYDIAKLEGALLDAAVALVTGMLPNGLMPDVRGSGALALHCRDGRIYDPSTNDTLSMQLLHNHQVFLEPPHDVHRSNIGPNGKPRGTWETYESWHATVSARVRTYPNPNVSDPQNWPGCVGRGEGRTPHVAICRAVVASYCGDYIEMEV